MTTYTVSSDTLHNLYVNVIQPHDTSHLFPGIIPKQTPIKFGKIVFSSSATDANSRSELDETRLNPSCLDVWTTPSAVSSVEYALAVWRLSHNSPSVFLAIAHILRQKISALSHGENGQGDRYQARHKALLRDIEVSLLCTHKNAVSLCAALQYTPTFTSDNIFSPFWFRRVFSEICRLALGLSGPPTAVKCAAEAVELLPNDSEMHACLARCAVSAGLQSVAYSAFSQVLSLDTGNPEGLDYIRSHSSIDNALSNEEYWNEITACRGMKNGAVAHVKSSFYTEKSCDQIDVKMDVNGTIIENQVRLSNSVVWTLQSDFYKSRGTCAWSNGNERRKQDMVPFYITSNPYFAREYAKLIFYALIDLARSGNVNKASPVYVLEIGAGHGRFTVLFVRYLEEMLAKSKKESSLLHDIVVLHVAADVTSSSFSEWSQHPDVQDMLVPLCRTSHANGDTVLNHPSEPLTRKQRSVFLDFALFDAELDNSVHLIRSNNMLSPDNPTQNVVFAIGNYLFDSLTTDVFAVEIIPSESQCTGTECRLYECLLTQRYSGEKAKNELSSEDIRQCSQTWSREVLLASTVQELQTISSGDGLKFPSYYTDKFINNTFLNTFLKQIEEDMKATSGGDLRLTSCFTIPSGGLRLLSRLRALSTCALVSLIADKGFNSECAMSGSPEPVIACHGSISVAVNMSAVESCMKQLGSFGRSAITKLHAAPIDICIGICDVTGELKLPLIFECFHNGLCSIPVHDLLVLRDHIEDSTLKKAATHCLEEKPNPANSHLALRVIVGVLEIGAWDADILMQFSDSIDYYVKCFTGHEIENKIEIQTLLERISNHANDIELSILPIDRNSEFKVAVDGLLKDLNVCLCNISRDKTT